MPSDQGLRLKENQGSPPVSLQSPESEPAQPISMAESGFTGPSSEHSELMPKRRDWKPESRERKEMTAIMTRAVFADRLEKSTLGWAWKDFAAQK
jgi:hypothetical protein